MEGDQGSVTAARFSRGAEAYLRLWSPVLCPHAARLLDGMHLTDAERVLDLGTGVGALLPELGRAAPRASLFGVDLAVGMLALAPKSIPVLAMDAARLAFRSSSFDAVVMAFVLFLLPDPIEALAEARRVLRPGGILGVATWEGEPTYPALEIWREELASLCFPLVRWPTLTANEEELSLLLARAGFDRTLTWNGRFLFQPTLDAFLEVRVGLGKVWLDTLTPDARSALLERVRRRLSMLTREGFAHRAVVLYAAACAD